MPRKGQLTPPRVVGARRQIVAPSSQAERYADVGYDPTLTPAQRYAIEMERTAPRRKAVQAEVREAVQRAIARAESGGDRVRGGNGKLRNLHLKSDPKNALINALDPWGFAE